MARRRPGGMPSLRLLAIRVILALLLIPAPYRASRAETGANQGIAAAKGRARTVAELAAMYDSRHCGDCHVEIYRDWERSIHSRSLFGTGRTALTFLTMITNGLMEWRYAGVGKPREIRIEHLAGCTKCHLPQLEDATDDVAREIVSDLFAWRDAVKGKDLAKARTIEARIKSLNIGCLICHNRNAIVLKWTDGYPRTREVYGSRDGTHPCGLFPARRKSPVMGESILCGQCHGLGPNFEMDNPTQCATAYGSYLFGYVAEGGRESCQDCHMRKDGLGHNIQSYRDARMAGAALDFRVSMERILTEDGSFGPSGPASRVAVTVAMTNKAGHSIPDG